MGMVLEEQEIPRNQLTNIRKILGRGGFGEVRLVMWNKPTGEQEAVAVKKLLRRTEAEERYFLAEYKYMCSLKGPGIAKVIGKSTRANSRYPDKIIMRFYNGGPLDKFVAQYPTMNYILALALLADVQKGLERIAEANIIHRDIKPRNILVCDDNPENRPTAVITDFGLAVLVDSTGYIECGHQCGTPGYMAPEVNANKRYNHKADVFSFGVTSKVILDHPKVAARQHPFWLMCCIRQNPNERPEIFMLRNLIQKPCRYGIKCFLGNRCIFRHPPLGQLALQPIQEQPVQEQPVQEQQMQEQPVQEQPVQKQPVQEQQIQEQSVQEGQMQEQSVQELLQQVYRQMQGVQEMLQQAIYEQQPVQQLMREQSICKQQPVQQLMREQPMQQAMQEHQSVQEHSALMVHCAWCRVFKAKCLLRRCTTLQGIFVDCINFICSSEPVSQQMQQPSVPVLDVQVQQFRGVVASQEQSIYGLRMPENTVRNSL